MPRRSSRAKYYNSTAVSDLKNKLDFWNHSYGVSWDQTKSVRITGSDGTILYTPYYRVDYVSKEIFFTKALSAARPKLETVILFLADTAFGRVFRCSREPNAKLRDLRRCRQNDFQFQSSNNTEHTRLLRYMTEPLPPSPPRRGNANPPTPFGRRPSRPGDPRRCFYDYNNTTLLCLKARPSESLCPQNRAGVARAYAAEKR